MKLAGFLLLLGAIAIRLVPADPSVAICSAFWTCLVVGNVLQGTYFLIPGMLCNAAAMLANGGVMPVYGQEGPFTGWHVQGTEDMSLQFLCDHFLAFSLGDLLLTVGLVVGFVLYRPRRRVAVAHR